MNEPMESRAAELEDRVEALEKAVVAPVAVAAEKRRLSIGAVKYLRRDKERFTFVWHLEKRPQEINLED